MGKKNPEEKRSLETAEAAREVLDDRFPDLNENIVRTWETVPKKKPDSNEKKVSNDTN